MDENFQRKLYKLSTELYKGRNTGRKWWRIPDDSVFRFWWRSTKRRRGPGKETRWRYPNDFNFIVHVFLGGWYGMRKPPKWKRGCGSHSGSTNWPTLKKMHYPLNLLKSKQIYFFILGASWRASWRPMKRLAAAAGGDFSGKRDWSFWLLFFYNWPGKDGLALKPNSRG